MFLYLIEVSRVAFVGWVIALNPLTTAMYVAI